MNHNSAQHQSHHPVPDNRIGWTNNNNYAGINANPSFPPLPQPNFFPNFFPQFPFSQFPNVFPYQNNFHQAHPNYPPGPQINPNHNQGHGSFQHNQGPLPYPPSNTNHGFPTLYPNRGNDDNNLQPNHGQLPQTNVHQGIPTGNINRVPGANNLNPNEGQSNLNQVTTTVRTRVPTTIQPTTSTIINNIFSIDDEDDQGVDYQFPQAPDFSKPNNSSGIDIRTETTKKPNVNNTRFSGSNLGKTGSDFFIFIIFLS